MIANNSAAQLSPTELRVAELLARGVPTRNVGPRLSMSPNAVKNQLRAVRQRFSCIGASQAALAHALLSTRTCAPPPAPQGPAPTLSERQQTLLLAIASQPTLKDIAREMNISPDSLQGEISQLLLATGSVNALGLVVRAHAWGLLGTVGQATATAAAGQ
ncbi:hypothetical protein [Streptomyces sp. NPDC002520]